MQQKIAVLSYSMAVVGLLLTAGCSGPAPGRALPVIAQESADRTSSDYASSFVENPEMFPRERLRAERTLELRLTWAMTRATEKGKIHVRAIAPPLQVTGDPNVDLSLTHRVLLIADDLKPDETFTNVYEVRVGPAPDLVTVRPAQSSDSLAEADKALIEEQLTRLRLDKAALNADEQFAVTLLPGLTNHWLVASKAAVERQASLTQQIRERDTPITNAQAKVKEVTNKVTEASQSLDHAKMERDSAAAGPTKTDAQKKVDEADGQLTQQKAALLQAQEELSALELEVKKRKDQNELIDGELALLGKRIETVRLGKDLASSTKEAIDGLVTFWRGMLERTELLSAYSIQQFHYSMRSAVVVSFRAESLKRLAQVTIDVIRKNLSPTGATNTVTAAPPPDALKEALDKVQKAALPLNALLLANDRILDAESRANKLEVAGGKLQETLGGLVTQVQLYLTNAPQIEFPEEPSPPLPQSSASSQDLQKRLETMRENQAKASHELQTRRAGLQARLDAVSKKLQNQFDALHGSLTSVPPTLTALEQALQPAQLTNQSKLSTNQLEIVAACYGRVSNHVAEVLVRPSRVTAPKPWTAMEMRAALEEAEFLLLSGVQMREEVAKLGSLPLDPSGRQPMTQAQGKLEQATDELASNVRGARNALREKEAEETALAVAQEAENNAPAAAKKAEDKVRNDVKAEEEKTRAHAWAAEDKARRNLQEVRQRAIKNEDNIRCLLVPRLTNLTTCLSNFAFDLRLPATKSKTNRRNKAWELNDLRQKLAEVTPLAEKAAYWKALKEKPSERANPLARGEAGADELNNDVVGRILRGEQAVFRLNVLHGVVSTTAFLLADDAAAQLFGQSFADQFYVAQVTFRNPNDRPILIYGNTMRLVVRMNAPSLLPLAEDGQMLRKIWWATWEPLDYDAVRRMVEAQQEHSWQKRLEKAIDLASVGLGFYGVAADPTKETLRFIAAFGGMAPPLKNMLEADLKRNAVNFREKGLSNIEEIEAQKTITRCVFLPKGPIYGNYAVDIAEANELPFPSAEGRLNPFKRSSRDFGKRALQPSYIHDIRREEVYVDGKRILASDPLTSTPDR